MSKSKSSLTAKFEWTSNCSCLQTTGINLNKHHGKYWPSYRRSRGRRIDIHFCSMDQSRTENLRKEWANIHCWQKKKEVWILPKKSQDIKKIFYCYYLLYILYFRMLFLFMLLLHTHRHAYTTLEKYDTNETGETSMLIRMHPFRRVLTLRIHMVFNWRLTVQKKVNTRKTNLIQISICVKVVL